MNLSIIGFVRNRKRPTFVLRKDGTTVISCMTVGLRNKFDAEEAL